VARPEERERDRCAAKIGALPGILLHRCEPMTNRWGVVALPEGFPDWLAIAEGQVELVEWKSRDGRLTPEQVKYHGSASDAGYEVLIARDAGQCCRDLAARWGGAIAPLLLKCAEELDAGKKIGLGQKSS